MTRTAPTRRPAPTAAELHALVNHPTESICALKAVTRALRVHRPRNPMTPAAREATLRLQAYLAATPWVAPRG